MSKRNRGKGWRQRLSNFFSWLFKPDARLLITVGGLASLIAAIFIGRNDLLWLSLPVCYVWMTGIFFAYFLRLIYLGRFVLPPSATHTEEDRATTTPSGLPATREGVYLLFYHAFILLLPSSIRNRMGLFQQSTIPEGLPESFKTYRAGIVPSHLTVSFGSSTAFTRAAGPGYVRANRFETVRSTFDLRVQSRSKNVSVTSKDGIPIDTTVSALFMVRQPAGNTDESIPYPYDRDTLFRLLYADSLESDDAEVHWSSRICPSIEAALVNEISKYDFDELFRPPGTTLNEQDIIPVVTIREAIRENLRLQLQQKFEFDNDEENPLLIIDADFGDLTPPPEVIKQRINNWRTEWELEQQRQRLQSEAEAIFTHRVARANAQMQMIDSVTDLLADIEETPHVDLSEVITLRLLEALDRIIEEHQPEPEKGKKERKKSGGDQISESAPSNNLQLPGNNE